jgi:hypothetical protein
MRKKTWVAFILNLFFFGGGYIYNGKRVGYGIALVIAWLLIRIGEIQIYLTHLVNDYWLIMFTGLVVMQFNFAIDAYKEAKAINENS